MAPDSEDGYHCGDRQAQQGAATDASAVSQDIPEFHRAAGREVLTAFEDDAQNELRQAYYKLCGDPES